MIDETFEKPRVVVEALNTFLSDLVGGTISYADFHHAVERFGAVVPYDPEVADTLFLRLKSAGLVCGDFVYTGKRNYDSSGKFYRLERELVL